MDSSHYASYSTKVSAMYIYMRRDQVPEWWEGLSRRILWLGSTQDHILGCSHTARLREAPSPVGLGDSDGGWGWERQGSDVLTFGLGLAVRRPDVFLKEMNITAVQPSLLKYGQESSLCTGSDQLVEVSLSFTVNMVVSLRYNEVIQTWRGVAYAGDS